MFSGDIWECAAYLFAQAKCSFRDDAGFLQQRGSVAVPPLARGTMPKSPSPTKVKRKEATPTTSSPDQKREVTAVEYNRWLVESNAKSQAVQRKETHEQERQLRKELQEKYRMIGHDRSAEHRNQMTAAKSGVDNLHSENLSRGKEVKEEVDALKKAREKQTEMWLEHGSTLARTYGSEQKKRIKSTIGAMSTRKREDAAALKAGVTEQERERAERKQKEVEDAQKLKREILDSTSDAVTREAKDTFFKQRKAGADDTRTDMKAWKDSRGAQKEAYATKAASAKREVRARARAYRRAAPTSDTATPTPRHLLLSVPSIPHPACPSLPAYAQALAAKKAAKEALEGVRIERAAAAKAMRDKQRNMESNFGKAKDDVGATKKQVRTGTFSIPPHPFTLCRMPCSCRRSTAIPLSWPACQQLCSLASPLLLLAGARHDA